MSQPAPNQGAKRKYQPGQSTDGKSSATLQRYDGEHYQGEDVDLNELEKWKCKLVDENADGSEFKLEYRDLLMSMRQAEYVVIPYQFRYPQQKDSANGRTRGNWVLIVMRVEAIELGRTLYDRCVSDIAIIDPDPSRREERAGKIWNRLRLLLEYAHIRVDANLRLGLLDNAFKVKDIEPGWMTGHVCYQYAHELFRRLRCLLEEGVRGYYDASFWGPLEEGYNTELARKTMLAACANRVIEKSEHYGRLAIEFPGFASDRDAYNYRPADLDPRTESEKEFDGSDDTMQAPRHKALDSDQAEKIGMWSLYLDDDQKCNGNWCYVQTMGEFPKREDCTRDEARWQFAVESEFGPELE
ncbi:hypothetical protein PG984_008712 [Apiospora sp. TS-2023a]